ncbi:MAG TPA: DUF2232 domain-containing protein [Candidatus Binatia bacterium]|nr:DUF2232 domain-containing protein [Candidatus Binatia bacterium]
MQQLDTAFARGAFQRWLRATLSTALLFLSGVLLPVVGPFLVLVCPQPGLRLAAQARTQSLVALTAVVSVIVAAVAGPAPALLYALGFGLPTIVLPILLARDWSLEVTVGCATAIVAAALLCAVASSGSPAELFAALQQALDRVREEAVRVYGRAGLAADVVRELEQGSVRLAEVVLRVTPALFVLAIASMVLLNLELLRRSQRSHGAAPVFGDLTRWKCPPELVWLLIAGGYGTFLMDGGAQWVAANLFAVLLAVYFCQGLVIAQFYMRRWRSPFWVVALVYLFIVVEWLLATGVTLLGVFDLWADFRRLNPRPVEED